MDLAVRFAALCVAPPVLALFASRLLSLGQQPGNCPACPSLTCTEVHCGTTSSICGILAVAVVAISCLLTGLWLGLHLRLEPAIRGTAQVASKPEIVDGNVKLTRLGAVTPAARWRLTDGA